MREDSAEKILLNPNKGAGFFPVAGGSARGGLMMKRFVGVVLALFLSLTLCGTVWSQSYPYPIMQPDEETLRQWMEEHENGPTAFIDEVIHDRLVQAQAIGLGTSMSLLSYLEYDAAARNQASCGDCWVWASTGILEIALNVQNNIKDRLSTQFLQSCKSDKYACCGGNVNGFADWYRGKGFMIPWDNTNAFFQDGSRTCDNGSSTVSCGAISTTSNYPITSIQPQIIPTTGVGQAKAISNIKNILNQKKGVWYAFFLANSADWNAFFTYWKSGDIWNPDPYSGHTWVDGEGGGHAVLIVGYNDDNPANPYWIVLNSWGTNGQRSDGLFRLGMNINYDGYMNVGTQKMNFLQFATYDVTFNPKAPATQKPNLTPYRPSDWSDKIVVSDMFGTEGNSFVSTDILYVNFALLNDSETPINSKFYGDLYVDEELVGSWYWNSLGAYYYGYLNESYEIGPLSAGTHHIKIVADSENAIVESNENDNSYTKIITVAGIQEGPDLSAEFAYLIRSCRISWTSISCKLSGIIEIDNLGTLTAPATKTEVWLYDDWYGDFTRLQRISTSKLYPDYFKTLNVRANFPAGETGAGMYIIIYADADDKIAEMDEDNNFLVLGPIDDVTSNSQSQHQGEFTDIIRMGTVPLRKLPGPGK
jgi:hypothetical protein